MKKTLIKKPSKATAAGFYLLLAAMIWGFAFVAQRVGADYVGSFTFNGLRFLLGAVSLLPVVLIFDRPARGQRVSSRKKDSFKNDALTKQPRTAAKALIFASLGGGGILFFAANLQQMGVEITGTAGKAGFITGLYIVLVPIIRVLFGNKPSVFVIISVVAAVAGMYLLCMDESFGAFGAGDIVLLFGALCWAFHILFIDRFVRNISALKYACGQFIVCGVMSMIAALITEPIVLTGITGAAPSILYAGILSVGVAYTLQIVGQRHIEPEKAAVIFSGESLFSVIGGALILGEVMNPRGYIGCLLIFAAIIIAQMRVKKPVNS